MLDPLAAGAVLLASFVGWALDPTLGRHRRVTPLVDLRLFRVRSFTGAASLMFISGLSMYGALLLLPLPRASVPDASSVTRIMQQVGGSFGTAVLAVILAAHSFQETFWWSVAFTALAVLPAAMLPRRAAARGQGRRTSRAAEPAAPGR